MYNIFWKRTQDAPLPQAVLDGVWRVDADESYHIHPTKQYEDGHLVGFRTRNGQGLLEDRQGRTYLLSGDTLIFFSPRDILGYRTQGDRWSFYWFEFHGAESLSLPVGKLYEIPFSASEKEEIQQCYLNLSSAQQALFFYSQASFLRLLFSWLTYVPTQNRETDLVGLLERGSRQNQTIPQIARSAGMCERSFRNEIRRLTGLSPMEYLTRLRLDTAMEILCTTDKTVQEIADSLHFGTPFYFGRVFKQHFGITPGEARRGFSEK